jgi:phytoene dehydrogenase-like protein
MTSAVVVGSGPNGLAAAITLARAGVEVELLERAATVGGGLRSAEPTLPGFRHDLCSAVHAAALASRFFLDWGLAERVPFVAPEVSYGHPLDIRSSGIAYRDLERTADELGDDGRTWRRMFAPLAARWQGVTAFTGDALLRWPEDPVAAFRFGMRALRVGTVLGPGFTGEVASAMLAGVGAHTIGRQPSLAAAAVALTLGMHAHVGGWGFPIGGSQTIADAMADDLRTLGGQISTGADVRSSADLPSADIVVLDTGTDQLLRLGADRLPDRYARALRRYRRGSGVAKVDFALDRPIPWADARLREAPTVHLGGSAAEIAAGERDVAEGRMPQRPFVLLTQPTIHDPSRAPAGKHIAWAYLHVPNGLDLDATELITQQIERFAPGFRDTVLASAALRPSDLERENPNDLGGDILGGAVTMWQLLKRPVVSPHPWRVPIRAGRQRWYLCSSSTAPGPGVHGMGGLHAAELALRDVGLRAAGPRHTAPGERNLPGADRRRRP